MLDGITTTPTIFRRLGVQDVRREVERLAAQIAGEVHVEALGHTADEIVEVARCNHEICPAKIVAKIPISAVGLAATSRLTAQGIRVNVHLVFTLNQAMLAARAGASYVCPRWAA